MILIYTIERHAAVFDDAMYVVIADGDVVFRVTSDYGRGALSSHETVFVDREDTPVFIIDQGFWDVDFTVRDPATREKIAVLEDAASFFGRRWKVLDAAGTHLATVREDGWKAKTARFFEELSSIPTPAKLAICGPDGRRIGRARWRVGTFDRPGGCVVELDADSAPGVDPRLLVAAVVQMDIEEREDRMWEARNNSGDVLSRLAVRR